MFKLLTCCQDLRCQNYVLFSTYSISISLNLSDREGQGHRAVLYKSHFPATKALQYIQSIERHHCIHRLINHVYYQRTKPFVIYCPTTWWQLGHKNTEISGILALDVWPIANQSDLWRGAHSGIAFSHSDCRPSFMRNKCAC